MREKLSKETKIQIGARIRILRDRSGYTQEKLAELLGVSVQYISDLERGVVGLSIATLIRICKTLHSSSDYILMGRDDTYSYDSADSSDSVNSFNMVDFLNAPGRFDYLSDAQMDLIKRGAMLFMEAFEYNIDAR